MSLKAFIITVLDAIIPSGSRKKDVLSKGSIVKSLTNEASMSVWETGMTTIYENPNTDHNYEFLEWQGDSLMAFLFGQYIKKRVPEISEAAASELKSFYLSTKNQAEIADQMGLPEHIISTDYHEEVKSSPKIKEDLLEAFFGALMRNCVREFDIGMGVSLAYNLMVHIFKPIKIDWSMTLGNPKTQVKEIIENLPGGQVGMVDKIRKDEKINVGLRDERWRVTINLPRAITSLLGDVKLPSPLVVVEERLKDDAQNMAYSEALKILNENGFNRNTVWELKRSVGNRVNAQVIGAAEREMERLELVNLYFTKVPEYIPFIQLIGIDAAGDRHVLMTSHKRSHMDQVYKEMLEQLKHFEWEYV